MTRVAPPHCHLRRTHLAAEAAICISGARLGFEAVLFSHRRRSFYFNCSSSCPITSPLEACMYPHAAPGPQPSTTTDAEMMNQLGGVMRCPHRCSCVPPDIFCYPSCFHSCIHISSPFLSLTRCSCPQGSARSGWKLFRRPCAPPLAAPRSAPAASSTAPPQTSAACWSSAVTKAECWCPWRGVKSGSAKQNRYFHRRRDRLSAG